MRSAATAGDIECSFFGVVIRPDVRGNSALRPILYTFKGVIRGLFTDAGIERSFAFALKIRRWSYADEAILSYGTGTLGSGNAMQVPRQKPLPKRGLQA